jgi:hypothetical protein
MGKSGRNKQTPNGNLLINPTHIANAVNDCCINVVDSISSHIMPVLIML